MPYRFLDDESPRDGLRRVAREQIDRALGELEDPDLDRHATVHQVRKRCKKIRGLVRLFRPAMEETYRRENAHFRDAARSLSQLRDAEALLEALDELKDAFGERLREDVLGRAREVLEERRGRIADSVHDLDRALEVFRGEMEPVRERVAGWRPEGEGFDTVAGGLGKTYRRARKVMQAVYEAPSSEGFHQWRKRVKYHWYHCRLLRQIWRPVMEARARELKRLSDLLGDDHDLAVLTATILDRPGPFGEPRDLQILLGTIDRRRAELQTLARPLGARHFAEGPGRLVGRFREYWEAWQDEAGARPPLGDEPVAVGLGPGS